MAFGELLVALREEAGVDTSPSSSVRQLVAGLLGLSWGGAPADQEDAEQQLLLQHHRVSYQDFLRPFLTRIFSDGARQRRKHQGPEGLQEGEGGDEEGEKQEAEAGGQAETAAVATTARPRSAASTLRGGLVPSRAAGPLCSSRPKTAPRPTSASARQTTPAAGEQGPPTSRQAGRQDKAHPRLLLVELPDTSARILAIARGAAAGRQPPGRHGPCRHPVCHHPAKGAGGLAAAPAVLARRGGVAGAGQGRGDWPQLPCRAAQA